MTDHNLLRKDQLELSLHQEKKLIEEGVLKEDFPFDVSENFRQLCEATRRGDLKVCQEMISQGVNINAKDEYDYTPLILASLCGHYETVRLLLESGALCERDTFQGERTLYNALNDRIKNLLLQYDYSKSTDPLQPLTSHLTSLLYRQNPKTADIVISGNSEESFPLHKFILSARSPYFRKKLDAAPDTTTWKLPTTIPPPSFGIALKNLYLGELPREIGGGPGTGFTDSEVLAGVDRISKHLEIRNLSELILDDSHRRLARQRRQDEVETGVNQIATWFRNNVLYHSVKTETSRAGDVKWDRNNGIFADILLQADEDDEDNEDDIVESLTGNSTPSTNVLGIPLGSGSGSGSTSRSHSRTRRSRKSVLYPCHKAMLIRSEFFMTMFESQFREAQNTPHLQIIAIDCSPAVLEIILTFLYTERVDFGLDVAVDVLFAADMLFLEKLKAKAAVVISTLGNGTATGLQTQLRNEDIDLDIYEILRAAWTTRVQRLEEFAARYMAYRLEQYIDEPTFAEIVKESAGRIKNREETDTIELLDDIRHFLSERFRLRFEDTGFDEVIENEENAIQSGASLPSEEITTKPDGEKDTPESTPSDEGIDMSVPETDIPVQPIQESNIVIRTLDGEVVSDEMEQDALNYQILLNKIDGLLDHLKLDA